MRIFQLFFMIFTLLLMACGGGSSGSNGSNNSSSTATSDNFNYRLVTDIDINNVKTEWATRDLSAKDVRVVYEQTTEHYKVNIFEHTLGLHKHYGAVVVPINASKKSFPVVVSPSGLDQENPSISLENNLGYYNYNYVMVIPAFRGMTLRYQAVSFFSGGDFCDAWDGATDDTIALLNVVEAHTPEADMQKVLVSGYSRGGNVALLMAERDSRIKVVVAGAGPVDFYRQEVANRYGYQYTCQFITGKTEAESRQRMLASSPLYFNILPNVEKVYLFQGGADFIVPQWNGDAMNVYLLAQQIDVNYYLYPNLRHDNVFRDEIFVTDWNNAHKGFDTD